MIATFNSCGRFSSIKYRMSGRPGADDFGCTAYATELSSGEVVEGPTITIGLAKKEGWYGKSGSKWQSMPDLMLRYRAASWMIRTVAPEISMGIKTQEEVLDTWDLEQDASGQFTVTQEDLRAAQTDAEAPATAEPVEEASVVEPAHEGSEPKGTARKGARKSGTLMDGLAPDDGQVPGPGEA